MIYLPELIWSGAPHGVHKLWGADTRQYLRMSVVQEIHGREGIARKSTGVGRCWEVPRRGRVVGISGFLPVVLTAAWHGRWASPRTPHPASYGDRAERRISCESFLLGSSSDGVRHGNLRGHLAFEDIS